MEAAFDEAIETSTGTTRTTLNVSVAPVVGAVVVSGVAVSKTLTEDDLDGVWVVDNEAWVLRGGDIIAPNEALVTLERPSA